MKKISALPSLLLSTICALGLMTSVVSAQSQLVAVDTVFVGDAGNAPTIKGYNEGYGSVGYEYRIGKYEVTIGQYATFLNAVAQSDVHGLWNENMAYDLNVAGIARNGSYGSYSYSVINNAGSSSNRPITYVTWFDAARFCNWLHNGATNGADTETGAYILNGATNGNVPSKDNGARFWIPSENEWVKSAYYKGGGTNAGSEYWIFPTRSDELPGNVIGANTNQVNYRKNTVFSVTQSSHYSSDQNYLADVGSFSNCPSFYGTFDQGGSVDEWIDLDGLTGSQRALRGGSWLGNGGDALPVYGRYVCSPLVENKNVGFRVATVSPTSDIDNDGVIYYREVADGTDPNDATSFNPLSKGLVAYYPFDGDAIDESGYGRSITNTNFLFVSDRDNKDNKSLALASSFAANNTIYLSANAPRTFTEWVRVVEFGFTTDPSWVKPNVAFAPFPSSVIKGNGFAVDGEWWMDTGNGVATYHFGTATNWMHIAVVYQGAVTEAQVYLNGMRIPLKSWTSGQQAFPSGDYNTLIQYANSLPPTNLDSSNLLDDVRVYDRALSKTEIAQLYVHEVGSMDRNHNGLIDAAEFVTLFSATRLLDGQADVTTNPSAFNLFTQEQFNSNRTAGQTDVIGDPMSYGLYTSNSIMDLRMSGLMIQKQGTSAVVSFQTQTTTDLTLPFTNSGTPITNTIPMPGNKGFIRINAKP